MPSFGQNHEQGKDLILYELAVFLEHATDVLTSGVPTAEQLSWAPKEAAAQRYLDGVANPDDMAILEGEASETGETLDELATAILRKAAGNRLAVSKLSGLRRATEAAITAANSREAAQEALDAAKARWYTFLTQLGA